MEISKNCTITLISSDSQTFVISKKAAMRVELIKDSIDDNQNNVDFPVPTIKGEVLKKVVEYLEHYENQEPPKIECPLPNRDFKDIVGEWNYNYIDDSFDRIISLIQAANYQNINSLLQLGSAKVASSIIGKTTEEIKELFGITTDFTPEEQQDIIKENKYFEIFNDKVKYSISKILKTNNIIIF